MEPVQPISDMRAAPAAPSVGVLTQICGEVAAAFRRAWGRGPVKASAHWAGPDMIVLVLQNGHTDAEKALRAAGYVEQLLEGRALLQTILEHELTAIVEQATGRRVLTVLSATRLDPDLSSETFLLEPKPDRRAGALGRSALHAAARAQS
jgi:uncharacterized protein YbcI